MQAIVQPVAEISVFGFGDDCPTRVLRNSRASPEPCAGPDQIPYGEMCPYCFLQSGKTQTKMHLRLAAVPCPVRTAMASVVLPPIRGSKSHHLSWASWP